jgi:antitoxin MazE
MQTTIVKWGNSQGIRIPKLLLESANLSDNDTVEITAKNGNIIIKKVKIKNTRKTIEERFKDFNDEYEPEEIDWGSPTGKEVW